ncbi:MAG: FHA domain-containing protein [Candidatus Sericytochromatia bacterium]
MKQEQNQSLEEINTKRVRLVVSKGGTENREFPLNKEVCYIGRWDPSLNSYPDVDLSDEDIDAKVSRVHAKIIKKPEGLYIEDMGSRKWYFP